MIRELPHFMKIPIVLSVVSLVALFRVEAEVKVDLGPPNQQMEAGWISWDLPGASGTNDASSNGKIPPTLQRPEFGEFTVEVSAVNIRDRGKLEGEAGFLGRDGFMATVEGPGKLGFSMSLSGLDQGDYRLTTYHHDGSAQRTAMNQIQIDTKDALGARRAVDHGAQTHSGKGGIQSIDRLSEMARNEILFSAPPDGEVEFTFTRASDLPGANTQDVWLNGFELEQIREGEPLTPQWKKDALARIEQYRRGPIRVAVKNSAGEMVHDADISVDMLQHAFDFGVSSNAQVISGRVPDPDSSVFVSPEQAERYRQELLKLFQLGFNSTVEERSVKWNYFSDPERVEWVDETLTWLAPHDIRYRGHGSMWEKWSRIPADVKTDADAGNLDALRTKARTHVHEHVSYFSPRATDWEVLNEAIHESVLFDFIKEQDGEKAAHRERAEWFKIARAANPEVALSINEYDVIKTDFDAARYRDYVNLLKSHGAPIDIVGIQGHFANPDPAERSPEKTWQRINVIAETGARLKITEFDLTSDSNVPPSERAAYTEALLMLAYSHPQMDAFICWGFWDGRQWKNEAPIYDIDWNLKPGGQVLLDYISEKWWTKLRRVTGADGIYEGRGYTGRHRVKATFQGREVETEFDLGTDGAELELILPDSPTAD